MSNRCLRPLAALATIVYLSLPCAAQPFEMPTVRGEVRADSRVDFRDYRIELADLNHRGDVYRADLSFDGSFEFRRIPAGDYQLFVVTQGGDIVHQEFVALNPHLTQISVRLSATGKGPLVPGTVSITQLRHPPDRKAFQSFAAAQRFAAAGSPEKAAEELEKAVRISPEFADAYSNLAVQHMRMRRFPEAVAELTRALAIAGPNPLMLCNLAYAQLNLGRVSESLGAVHAALRLDAGYAQGHLILGSILAADPRTRAEAIPHLERAAETIPSARATLERARSAMQAAAAN
uniref:Tetratricopeptide TPR_2 repeat protein n=1 Tax=Solibacter usitatus (strain Ellin6076) TaxID=234267 RepID=Q027W0_SOLUE